jgi:integrase
MQVAIERAAPAAIAAFQARAKPPVDKLTLFGLITRYLCSPAFAVLAPRTQRDRRKSLERARLDLGTMELRALEAPKARLFLIEWRDRFARTPKTADDYLGDLSSVIQWAVDRGELARNPVRKFPRIYWSNRADAIWEAQDIAALLRHCDPGFTAVVQVAMLTGLRLGDVRRLPWSAVREKTIMLQTGKSNGRRTVSIPITEALQSVLDAIPRSASTTVLNSRRGQPWSEPGIESAMQRAKRGARAAALAAGRDGSGIEHLRFHDLRGTAVTNFVRAGLSIDEIALIVGWKTGQVGEIARRYVTDEERVLVVAERLQKNLVGPENVNQAVNRGGSAPRAGD